MLESEIVERKVYLRDWMTATIQLMAVERKKRWPGFRLDPFEIAREFEQEYGVKINAVWVDRALKGKSNAK